MLRLVFRLEPKSVVSIIDQYGCAASPPSNHVDKEAIGCGAHAMLCGRGGGWSGDGSRRKTSQKKRAEVDHDAQKYEKEPKHVRAKARRMSALKAKQCMKAMKAKAKQCKKARK